MGAGGLGTKIAKMKKEGGEGVKIMSDGRVTWGKWRGGWGGGGGVG